jgi:hypothetical protein
MDKVRAFTSQVLMIRPSVETRLHPFSAYVCTLMAVAFPEYRRIGWFVVAVSESFVLLQDTELPVFLADLDWVI